MVILRRTLTLLLVGVLILALGGCSLKQSEGKIPTRVISTLSDPKTFNTVTSQEVNPVFGFVEEGLITSDGDGNIQPALAESWEFADEGKRITFTLREGLRWSDGHPLTVDDVLFTYNDIYLNEAIPADFRDLLRIGPEGKLPTVKKIDERRVEFSIPEPFAPFLRYTGIGLMPKHKLEKAVKTKDGKGNPEFLSLWGVGTDPREIVVPGPFQLDRYLTGERVILKKNPYYWRKDDQGRSQPYIDRIAIQIVENQDTGLLQFRTGGLDSTAVAPSYYSLLKREEEERNFKIYNGGLALSSSFISFNLNTGIRNGKPLVDPVKAAWFNNPEFRKAIAYGIDRKKMLVNIYQGLGEPQYSYIPVQSPYYLSPEDGLPTYDYDLDRAKSLLQQAGFTYNGQNQLQDGSGNQVRFTLYTNAGNQIREAMGAQIKQDLAKLGIQVDFAPIAFNTLVQKLSETLEWDAYLLGFSGGGVEPHSSANVILSDGGLHTFNQKPRPGQAPLENREVRDWEREIDRIWIEASQEIDEAKRRDLYGQVQTILQEQLPFIFMINPLVFEAIRNRVQGVEFTALGGSTWNIYEQSLVE
ncbi:ABC transporter substrate-binding protein [Lyngbya confervoides]|uniref:ABC transporter substrate-binding protein n=1 Tax=Lyngbya confervoides BDU141951 TaxID=1574623 RepID=A0ABD4T4N7_9CYAN|nr:ABC transporter substrate-binding protein [Lyngbya confervoides]MCM1983202.1 ABC transporter substrate-binding protein [Lyngbya confervoides BDU141951]